MGSRIILYVCDGQTDRQKQGLLYSSLFTIYTLRAEASHNNDGDGKKADPEKRVSGSAVDCAVQDLGLLWEILGRFDGRHHALHGQERREVRRVRRDDDEREEPPHAADDTCRHGSRVDVGALLHQRTDGEPERVRQREDVLELGAVRVARVWVVPLVRTEPS